MGLTIHYDFETNKKTTDKQAERIMNDLWQFANTLKQTGALEEVSELFYINKKNIKKETKELIENIPGLKKVKNFKREIKFFSGFPKF